MNDPLNGITPWKLFFSRFKYFRPFISVINLGIVPLKWFEPRSRCTKPGIAVKESGIGPESELDARETFWSEIKSPNEVGISPFKAFDDRLRCSRFSSRVNEVGIFPFRLLPDKSMWVMFKCQRLGKEPVSVSDGDGVEVLEVVEEDRGAAGVDGGAGDGEVGEVDEAAEEDAGSSRMRTSGGWRRGRGEAGRGGGGAVDEGEGGEGGEGLEGGGGEGEVAGAVGEAEGEEVAKRGGRVAGGGVVEGGLRARVFGGWDVKGLESSELFWIQGGGSGGGWGFGGGRGLFSGRGAGGDGGVGVVVDGWRHGGGEQGGGEEEEEEECEVTWKGGTISFAHKRIYLDPNEREDRGQQHRPEHNDGRSPVLAAHETLEEWVQMKDHPKCKEHSAK
ncbi:LOW QUALITY PROTEIN: hypothetical protein RJ639_002786 [Escallonia herrerae]|uniref:Uncharacterized protein n=1 Tax=Escallonia herrerae TaxID=1293975 RepID=A0AA89AWF9_9ASTE|nr:LOW QUALITY PROTEIN: hypothetical protein RJ639_002786 [Escallonia herrerae]